MAKGRSALGRDFYSLLEDNMVEDKKDSLATIRISDIPL